MEAEPAAVHLSRDAGDTEDMSRGLNAGKIASQRCSDAHLYTLASWLDTASEKIMESIAPTMPVTLSDFIMSHAPATGGELHLAHCTSARASVQVLAARILSPSVCPVYGDQLLYMFYGRPAYKPGADLPASGILELAPVCLVLDPALLATAARILPFDSGGFSRYEPLLGPSLKLPEFELGNDPSAPLRLVGAFYETNANYYGNCPPRHPLNAAQCLVTRPRCPGTAGEPCRSC